LIFIDKKTRAFANSLKKLRFMWKLSPIIANWCISVQTANIFIWLLCHVWITEKVWRVDRGSREDRSENFYDRGLD